jgi:Telomeric single stranded DNA binding POT1/CDC13
MSMQAYRDGNQFATIDVDHPPLSPVRPARLPTYPLERTRSVIDVDETPTDELPDLWSSPAFLKHPRVSSVSFLNASYDPFADDDGYSLGKGRKRTKLSQQVAAGAEAESSSPAGTANGARMSLASQDEVDAPVTSTMEDAQTQTTFAVPDDYSDGEDGDLEMDSAPEPREEEQTTLESNQDGALTAYGDSGTNIEAAKESTLVNEAVFAQDADALQKKDSGPFVQTSEPRPLSAGEAGSPSEDENDKETPERMPTPRLGPLASPGLPLVSPLLKRSSGYFPFPSETRSQLDATSKASTLDYPPLPAFESAPQPVPEEATPSHLLDQEADNAMVDVDEESEESYVEEEPGAIEFDPSRSDIPHVRDTLIEYGVKEDDEVDSDQDMDDEGFSSEFEGFSTPGGPLKVPDEEDELVEDGSESAAGAEEFDEVEQERERGERAEMQTQANIGSESEEESGSKDEGRDEQSETRGLEKNLVEGKASEDELAESRGKEPLAALDDRDPEFSRSDKPVEEPPEPDELDQSGDEQDSEMEDYYEEDEESEVEEPEAPPAQRLQVPRIDEIIDLTEDSDEDEELTKASPEVDGGISSKKQDEEEQDGSDEELDDRPELGNSQAHQMGQFDGTYSRTDSFSYSSIDEVAIEQREDMPTSPVIDEDYDSERQSSQDEDELEAGPPEADAGDVSYPELPLADAGSVDNARSPTIPSETTQEAAEISEAVIDPSLSNQLMTPTATATASQLTSLLSRQSTALAQEEDHLLPTPQDTQVTAKITISQSTHLQVDGPPESQAATGELEGGLAETRKEAVKSTRPSVDVPEAMSMWFEPKRSSQIQVTESEAEGSASEEQEEQQVDHDAEQAEEAISPSSPQLHKFFSHALPESKGFTTPHAYFPLLSSLHSHFNTTVDIMAVSTTRSPKPQRAKSGPKDHFTTLTLTDPPSLAASHPLTQPITVVQIFRPYAKALPSVLPGDVVLLRAFKVQSQKHKMMLLSTEESGWVVFKDNSEHDVTSGPPVEFGAEERGFVRGLKVWWAAVGEKRFKEVDGENVSEETAGSPEAATKRMTRSSGSPENGARMVTRSMGPAGFSAVNGRS